MLAWIPDPDRALPPPGVQAPYSDAELAELRRHRTGRPLADFLREIGARS